MAGDVEDYIIGVVHASRDHEAVAMGASPRAMLALYQAVSSPGGRSRTGLCHSR